MEVIFVYIVSLGDSLGLNETLSHRKQNNKNKCPPKVKTKALHTKYVCRLLDTMGPQFTAKQISSESECDFPPAIQPVPEPWNPVITHQPDLVPSGRLRPLFPRRFHLCLPW